MRASSVAAAEAGGPSILTVSVPATAAGDRLDVFAGGLDQVGSRSRAAHLIDAGVVTVDGVARTRSFRLAEGQLVVIVVGEQAPPDLSAEPVELSIPYEDRWLLVVDKPAGMVVHPAPGHPAGTLVNALLAHGAAGGEGHRPGIVHRLDRDTSGLLIVAKDEGVHRRLQRLLRERDIDRRYLALVVGEPGAATGTIQAPIGRDTRRRTAMAVGGAAPRLAVTHFRVLERLAGTTLLEVRLETGRTHQIRVHLQAIGLPVAGDPVYGSRGGRSGATTRLGLGRQFLHSHRLRFVHPVTGEEVDVRSPLPPDLARALEAARGGTAA